MSILQTQQKTQEELRFIYIEVSEAPLERVSNIDILKSIIDPTTGEPYNGIILQGEFASLEVLNNNNRIYTEDNYIQFVENLKKQIFSKRGVYGELEHPTGYASNWNNASHKLLDIWYDKITKKVYGVLLVLNTPKGQIIQEVIKSGGQVGVSARASGSEVKNPDGTFTAVIKLLITFDVVQHPGFTTAVTDGIVNMNESIKFIYEDNIGKMAQLYESYIVSGANKTTNFIDWSKAETQLFETSKKLSPEEKTNESKLVNNKTNDEDEFENKLSSAVHKDLSQQQKNFYGQMQNAQRSLGSKIKGTKKQGKAYFDNSAGFINNGTTDGAIVSTSEDERQVLIDTVYN